MCEFVLEIAGKRIGVVCHFEETRQYCEGYLGEAGPVDFTVSITIDDVYAEHVKSKEEAKAEGRPFVRTPPPLLEPLAVYRKIATRLLEDDILLFHGSAICVDGEGYLFTAVSGTGKSTHTRLWREVFGDRAVMINDDKPLLKVEGDRVLICGTPWNGKHRLGSSIMVPLKGLCILTRGTQNSIEPISMSEVLPILVQQSFRPATAGAIPAVLELIRKIVDRAELYRLACNMDPEAATVAFEGMNRKEK